MRFPGKGNIPHCVYSISPSKILILRDVGLRQTSVEIIFPCGEMKIPLGEIIQTIDKTGQTGGGIISTVNWIISLLRRMTQTGVEPIPTDGEMKLPPD
ncbi:Uncharacterised protein [Sphingobacterium thalpophilum]|uniref:Uncharacterized protein n=2 Tax=Sphingobacterium thalpophilum TaxID=259 RepID=A0A4U9VDY6_9SPHI|nr:Uncharacterised protein [Sphingobacterium thalpophilum]